MALTGKGRCLRKFGIKNLQTGRAHRDVEEVVVVAVSGDKVIDFREVFGLGGMFGFGRL